MLATAAQGLPDLFLDFSATERRVSSAEFRRALAIRRAHIDYHYAFYSIIQPVRDRIVTDDFDLPGLERGILSV